MGYCLRSSLKTRSFKSSVRYIYQFRHLDPLPFSLWECMRLLWIAYIRVQGADIVYSQWFESFQYCKKCIHRKRYSRNSGFKSDIHLRRLRNIKRRKTEIRSIQQCTNRYHTLALKEMNLKLSFYKMPKHFTPSNNQKREKKNENNWQRKRLYLSYCIDWNVKSIKTQTFKKKEKKQIGSRLNLYFKNI